MNILFIAHERNLGGASKSLVTLVEEIRKRKNKVVVIVPFKSGQVYLKLKELGIPVYRVFFGWWMMPSYWNPCMKVAFRILYAIEKRPAAKIIKIARKEKIQIIHSNSSVVDIGALAAKMANLPHVWHFREFGVEDYQLEYLIGKKKSCEFITKYGGKIVFISKDLREYYGNEIPDRNCQIIYNGISEEFLNCKDYKKDFSKIIFLIAGNIHRNKGQDVALQAAKILRDKGYNNFELWIAGQTASVNDSKRFYEELREYANNDLQGYHRFLGYVSNMKELRKKTDLELVCSNREAFGRVTIEAMMGGNPVIGTDTGANPEIIKDKWNGRLFRNKDAKDLADKMKWFLDEPQRISECGKRSYLYAKENYLSYINTEKVLNIYTDLINPT